MSCTTRELAVCGYIGHRLNRLGHTTDEYVLTWSNFTPATPLSGRCWAKVCKPELAQQEHTRTLNRNHLRLVPVL